MSYSSLLNSTCAVQRRSQTAVGGAVGVTYTEVLSGLPCAVQVITGGEAGDRLATDGVRRFSVWVPAGTDLRHGDLITDFAGPDTLSLASEMLRVASPPIDPSGRGVVLQYVAEAHDGEPIR